jgi:hypothetical protein
VALAGERGASVRRPLAATATVFFANGLLFASWAAHIPKVKARLGLTDATLGVALLGAPAGSVSAMLAAARLMSGLHARWSIGAFAGAGAGALGVATGLFLTPQLLLLGLPALLIAGWLTTWMAPDSGRNADPHAVRRPTRRLSRAVLVLGAIAFASMLCEGASADWAAVYLRGSPRSPQSSWSSPR